MSSAETHQLISNGTSIKPLTYRAAWMYYGKLVAPKADLFDNGGLK